MSSNASFNPNRCGMSGEFCARNGCYTAAGGGACSMERMGLTPPRPAAHEPVWQQRRVPFEQTPVGYEAGLPPEIVGNDMGFGRDEVPPPTLPGGPVVILCDGDFVHPGPGDWLASLTSAQRKECAASRGFAAYFPDAIALVARHSVRMNEKHNPGEPVHWARGKSTDQRDCELRHLLAVAIDEDIRDADGAYEMVCKAWRAMADLQEWAERKFQRDGVIE